jgi:transposase
MLYVGVDVHKQFCQAAVVEESGDVLGEYRFENSEEGITGLASRFEAFGKPVKVAVESTANLWIQVYDRLEASGFQVVLSNPAKTRVIAEARIKTDKVDAKILAQLLRADMLPLCYVPNIEERGRRQLIRERMSFVKTRTEVKNRVQSLLHRCGFRCPYGDLFSKRGLEWLRGLNFNAVDVVVLKSGLALLDALNEQVAALESHVAASAVMDERVKLLMTMPGIDYFAASLLVSEICDIGRFRSDKALVCWAGLAQSIHQSGNVTRIGRITRQGNSRVRWVLVQCAQTARLHDERFRRFYEGYVRSKGHGKAIVAVAHEMLRIVYFMLKRMEPYRGEDRRLTGIKVKRLERRADIGLHAP